MTFEEIRLQIKESINRTAWTDEEIKEIFKRCEEEIELGFYKQSLIDNAARVVIKLLKKKAKKLK